ncbi:hypothetical protein HPB50_020298 [Hyalomma asiaticum]|uniref:Uncharacterized protein n=1 Tax=Hyalomma asiaticum TaxID=266040 RepID=A0ACB7SYE8_HYAAI|nr:hypothetical protein HPB50_020298 [Hyalomma asiaticum]
MVSGRCLKELQREHDGQTRCEEDCASPGHSHEDKAADNRKSASNYADGVHSPWSAGLLDFYLAPPPNTGPPGVPLSSCLRRNFVDKPTAISAASTIQTSASPMTSTSLTDRLRAHTSSSVVRQAKRLRFLQLIPGQRDPNVEARKTRQISTVNCTLAAMAPVTTQAIVHTRSTKNCENAQLDLPEVEHDLLEGLNSRRPLRPRRDNERKSGRKEVCPTEPGMSAELAVEVLHFYKH